MSEAEKLLLARLSVFAGSVTLASVIAVVAGGGIPQEQVGDLLLSLREKSLVQADPSTNEMRCRLLESTRFYASALLMDGCRDFGFKGG